MRLHSILLLGLASSVAACSSACSKDPEAQPSASTDGGKVQNPPSGDDTSSGDDQSDADVGDAAPPPTSIDYNPCPAAGTPCLVMPLGDSITYGVGSSSGGGYRIELLRKARASKHQIKFVGFETSGPDTLDGQPFPKNNEGHSGYTIDNAPSVHRDGISSLVVNALTQNKPHIVLLMIGTNDIDNKVDLANAPTRLGNLLDTITKQSPNALVVVAQIIPTQHDDENALVKTYNDAIPGVVSARHDAGKHVFMVDMNTPFASNPSFKTAYMSDYLHPNDTGHAVMAGVWYAAVGALFK